MAASVASLSSINGAVKPVAKTVAVAQTAQTGRRVLNGSLSRPQAAVFLPKQRICSSRQLSVSTVQCKTLSMEEQLELFKQNEKRWEANIRDGKVKSINASQARADGYKLLDIRPDHEYQKGHVEGSDAYHVPMFVPDDRMDPMALGGKLYMFLTGGWWIGVRSLLPNKGFLQELSKDIAKDDKVVVACQKGLRSLSACDILVRNGYTNVAWLNGGFEACKPGDWPSTTSDLREAGDGGMASFIGWTQLTRTENATIQQRAAFFGKTMGLFLVVDLVVLGLLNLNK